MIQISQGETSLAPARDLDWLRNNIENEEEILQYLDDPNNQLEDQPTEVLIELATKLKDRRTKHYEEMLRAQEEADRKTAEEEAASASLVAKKEAELQEEMEKANKAADDMKTVQSPLGMTPVLI